MPLTHLLDTSVYAQPLRPRPLPAVRARSRDIGESRMAVSIVSEAELLYGLRLRDSRALRARYERLLRDRLPVLAFDRAVAEAYAALEVGQKEAGRPVPEFDLVIAATALAHRLTIATLDVAHFSAIEDVSFEDWST